MRTINEKYNELNTPPEVAERFDPSEVLFFDIETTGLNKASTTLYLIGCGYYADNILCTRFFFGENETEEKEVLSAFFEFARNFNILIHFNGTKFDLPYLDYKAAKYCLDNPLKLLKSFDIYGAIKPLRYVLFRESMRQKCVEDFLGISRMDTYNGGELIPIYLDYSACADEKLFELLLLHNREDILGMHKMFPILNYLKLKDCTLCYTGSRIMPYVDIADEKRKEMLLEYTCDIKLPKSFSVKNNDIYFKFNSESNTLLIRLPIFSGRMKHYFENYNDYYYLPLENTCIHKSIAMSVDRAHKKKAIKDTCYIIVEGDFLPQESIIFKETAGFDYKTRNAYFKIPDAIDNVRFSEYGKMLVDSMLKAKPRKKTKQEK